MIAKVESSAAHDLLLGVAALVAGDDRSLASGSRREVAAGASDVEAKIATTSRAGDPS